MLLDSLKVTKIGNTCKVLHQRKTLSVIGKLKNTKVSVLSLDLLSSDSYDPYCSPNSSKANLYQLEDILRKALILFSVALGKS